MSVAPHDRRGFLGRLFSVGWLGALAPVGVSAAAVPQAASSGDELPVLPGYARAQSYTSRKQSSTDPMGGNADRWSIPAGGSHDVFVADGPGIISHIWFTIAASSPNHLYEIVLRAYWDGHDRPSVEVPIGAFFGSRLTTAPSRMARKFASLMEANSGEARTASQSDKICPLSDCIGVEFQCTNA